MIETHIHTPSCKIQAIEDGHEVGLLEFEIHGNILTITPVSYTHLTLPTID